jgi:calcineurin-like phosphoesterase family protein
MNVWFTSDLHFGHANIIDHCNRPYADVREMDAALVDNWNSAVGEEDVVYVLGDVAMGRLTDTLPLVQLLNGTKFLVPGNHDKCWRGHRKAGPQSVTLYERVGFTVLEGQHIYGDWLLCHFPEAGDSHGFDRYTAHRPKLQAGFDALIHGHVHEAWKVNGRQINVGVDVWDYKPVAYQQLRALVDSLP